MGVQYRQWPLADEDAEPDLEGPVLSMLERRTSRGLAKVAWHYGDIPSWLAG